MIYNDFVGKTEEKIVHSKYKMPRFEPFLPRFSVLPKNVKKQQKSNVAFLRLR